MPADLERIVDILATAPGWTRVGITAPDPRTRARATEAFAPFILDRLDERAPVTLPGQMVLPL